MDSDHKQLVQMISSLHEAMKAGQSKVVLEQLVTNLEKYATTHFSREEQHLAEIKHPEIESQIQQHMLFLHKVKEFKANYEMDIRLLQLKCYHFSRIGF